MSALARGRRVVYGVAAGAALMTAGGLLSSAFVKSPAQLAAETGPPAQGVLTAEVERRVLAETVVMRGTVVAGQSVAVAPQGEGRPVVTRLPIAAGAPVSAGRVVAEVSGRPVVALRGALPVYRDLRPGATGDDVAQLQDALRELGHPTGRDPRGRFGPGTKTALAALYRALGYPPLPAAPDSADRVRAARTALREAAWALEDAQATVTAGSTHRETTPPDTAPTAAGTPGSGTAGGAWGSGTAGGTSGIGTPGSAAATAGGTAGTGGSDGGAEKAGTPGSTGAAKARAVARARVALAEARAELAAAEAAEGPMLPAAEVVFLRAFPARVSGVGATVGAPVTGTLLTLTAGELLVEAYLKDDKHRLLRPGLPVLVSSELTGAEVSGKVTLVAAERSTGTPTGATAPDGEGRLPAPAVDLGYRMLVRPDRPLAAALTGQDVRLTVEAATTGGPALVVPVTAVSSGADGLTSVTTVNRAGTRHRIEVRTGTTGDGYVEIEPVAPATLQPGAQVITGTAAPGTGPGTDAGAPPS